MVTVDISFTAVTVPANTSASVTIYEDSTGDGIADNTDTIALSNGVTAYTSADVFDGGTGSQYWFDVDLDNTNDVSTASVTAPISMTVPDDVTSVASKTKVIGTAMSSTVYTNTWMLISTPLNTLIEESGKWNEVNLTYRVTAAQLAATFEAFGNHAGKLSSTITTDGEFKAYDRVSGSNTFSLTPPYGRRSIRHTGDYFVKKYKKTLADQAGKEFEINLDLVPEESLTLDTDQVNDTPSAGDWHFSFSNGSFATDRVRADIKDETKKGIGSKRLRLILDNDELKLLAQHAARQESVRVRSIPDGDDLYEDTSPNKRQAVYIVPPNERIVSEGSYRITSWEDTWLGDKHEVVLTIGPARSGNKQVAGGSGKTATLQTT